MDASNIEVKVTEKGEVLLSGIVPDYTTLKATTKDAWCIKGVSDVENNLKIEYPEVTKIPTEKEIKAKAKKLLQWNPNLNESKITISVRDREIELEGTVNAYWKKIKAEDVVGSAFGVIGVKNALAVVPSKNVVDETIAEEIVAAIKRNSTLNISEIDVAVKDGEVTLSGEVPDGDAYFTVNNIVIYTSGVTFVNNNLLIESKKKFPRITPTERSVKE